jgi:hypothetical protein
MSWSSWQELVGVALIPDRDNWARQEAGVVISDDDLIILRCGNFVYINPDARQLPNGCTTARIWQRSSVTNSLDSVIN